MAEPATVAAPTREELEVARARLRALQAKVEARGGTIPDEEIDPAAAIHRLRSLEARLRARRGGR